MDVAAALGKSPAWVARNMGIRQISATARILAEAQLDRQEQLARLVWAVANGWKRPVRMDRGGDEILKKAGIMEDAV